jgi:thiol-disulfide isomerase/thioredoxin
LFYDEFNKRSLFQQISEATSESIICFIDMRTAILLFLAIFAVSVYGQEIPRLNFTELSPLLNKKNDTTYIINFWATWCAPCVKELPVFEELNKESSSLNDGKTKVLLVSLDFSDDYDSKLLPFIEKKGISSEVVHLDDGKANEWIPKVNKKWTGAIPATLVFKGKKRQFIEGMVTKDLLYQTIEKVN